MSVEINQLKMREMFADPSAFYERMVNRKGYTPKQEVEFDAEILSTGWTAMGCVLLAVMIHHEKKAYVVMLSSDDCTTMRETLEQEQIGLNYRPEDASLRLRAINAQINEKEKRHMSNQMPSSDPTLPVELRPAIGQLFTPEEIVEGCDYQVMNFPVPVLACVVTGVYV